MTCSLFGNEPLHKNICISIWTPRVKRPIKLNQIKIISFKNDNILSCVRLSRKLLWFEKNPLTISQHRYRLQLGAIRWQTWTSVDQDLWCHISSLGQNGLTLWGPEMYIYISKLTIIGSGNGLSPLRQQAITWPNVALLSVGLLETTFNEIWIRILSFSFKKMHLKMLSAKMAAYLSREIWVKAVCHV